MSCAFGLRLCSGLAPFRGQLELGGGHLALEVEVGGGGSGDQTRPAAEGQVLDGPLDEDENPALELDQVHQVDERPDDPGGEAREAESKRVGDRCPSADYGEVSLVEVRERRRLRLALRLA